MYVAVLGSTMVITVTGLSALMLVRSERSSAVGTADLSTARFYAQSAIELGQHRIRQDSNWRQTYTSGAWESNRTIGTGKYTLEGIDPVDGNLSNSASDSVLLRGTGFEGLSRYKLQVTMVAKSSALTCLQVAAHAGNDLSCNSATISAGVTISTNNSVVGSSNAIAANVEAVNAITATTITGTKTVGITARTMPDASVFDYYVLNGTPIPYAVLSGSKIEKTVLSPNSNPYGVLKNPSGIYVIDCLGGNLFIRNTRIVGTLVILNPGAIKVENSVSWEPAISNYPALLVRGSAELKFTNTPLSESSQKVNFNPLGTPYQGSYDTDQLDTFPSKITGLVYVSQDLMMYNQITLDGALVMGGSLDVQSNVILTLTYRSTFYDNPPPGFGGAPEMVVSPGTWKQLVD